MAQRKVSKNIDQASIENQGYNERAGAQKNTEVGRSLLPLNDGTGGFTTSAAAAKALPKAGCNIAVYNNASTVGAVTLGTDATVAALAAGVCDASGNVGVPCTPNDWTFIACWDKTWIKSTAATLLIFVIADDSYAQ